MSAEPVVRSRPGGRVGRFIAALEACAGWQCLSDAPREDAYTMRNAASEAAQWGYVVDRRPCSRHRHRGRVFEYRLVREAQVMELPLV